MANELPIFIQWTEFLEWLLPTTAKFPRKVQLTFSQRIENLALDIAEELVVAQYTKGKRDRLREVNLKLERLRILLRLSHRLKYLPHEGYEHASRSINEIGRMLGGWIKQQDES